METILILLALLILGPVIGALLYVVIVIVMAIGAAIYGLWFMDT